MESPYLTGNFDEAGAELVGLKIRQLTRIGMKAGEFLTFTSVSAGLKNAMLSLKAWNSATCI
jgi:hypothetical protein